MNKRKIIIIGSVMLLFGIFELFYLFYARNKATQNNSVNQSQEINQGDKNFPLQNDSSSKQSPSFSNNKDRIRKNIISLKNPEDKDLVKKAFLSFYNMPFAGFSWSSFQDVQGKAVSSGKIFPFLGASINPQIASIIDDSNFGFYSCGKDDDIKDISLVTSLKTDIYSGENPYKKELASMKEWEKTMFKDMANIFFPNSKFSLKELNQKAEFKDGAYRYSLINLPNGEKSSINYAVVDEYIILSNSKDCIDQSIQQLYSTD